AGYCEKNIVQNCSYESGTVYGSNRSVGGIVGLCHAKVVSKCSAAAAVKVHGDSGGVGGIIGDCTSQTYDCINYATVEGKSDTGGIAGSIYNCGNDTGSVEKCINYGNVKAQGNAGGIAGSNKYTVMACKNYGKVTGNPAGDLVGAGNAANTFAQTTATALTHEKGALIISLIAFAVLAIAGCGMVIYKKRKKQVQK
ncbi:MAG: hypothetical protein K5639_03655, partial [Eubacterium sp.]|nr:hypothetical protein [Eubacterium sp.]